MPEPEQENITVVNVTFQGDEWDYDELVTLGGRDFRLVRVGTSGDAQVAEDHVWRWSLEADAIAVSGIREARAAGHLGNSVEDLERIKHTTERVPVRDDSLLADIFQEWAIRRVEAEMPGYFANARVVVVGGTTRERTIAVLREFTDNIVFDTAGHDLVLPGQVKTNPVTATAAGIGEFAWRHVPDTVKEQIARPGRLGQRQGRPLRRQGRRRPHRLVLRADALRSARPHRQGGDHEHRLRGPARRAGRSGRRPRRRRHPATLRLRRRPCDVRGDGRRDAAPGNELTTDDLAQFIQDAELEPRSAVAGGRRRKSRFSFVIHPLSTEYFKQRRAARADREHPRHGPRRREDRRLHPAIRLQPRDRRSSPTPATRPRAG